ncbi:hypothetical protein B0H14DRAFT_2619655 [Mycena olivaceomarginata]|nr:hypothetical protein B0H14DRAFT_2619655 [Mycena olivaceomarginata]
MQAGLWPQLLDVMAAAPVLSHRIIDNMSWYGHDREGFDFPTALRLPPLRELSYIAPYAFDQAHAGWYRAPKVKGPPVSYPASCPGVPLFRPQLNCSLLFTHMRAMSDKFTRQADDVAGGEGGVGA